MEPPDNGWAVDTLLQTGVVHAMAHMVHFGRLQFSHEPLLEQQCMRTLIGVVHVGDLARGQVT